MDFETGQGYGSAEWHPAVVVCEVEVDTETGQVTVPRIHAELYAGKIINPRLCELQIEGATTFGLGQVLFEEVLQRYQWEHYQSESFGLYDPFFSRCAG